MPSAEGDKVKVIGYLFRKGGMGSSLLFTPPKMTVFLKNVTVFCSKHDRLFLKDGHPFYTISFGLYMQQSE